MAAIQEPYEISVWEDKYDQDTQRYKEQKVAVIGADTFKAQCAALEPSLKKNVNGTSTFTFKMLRECYDLDIIENLYGYLVQDGGDDAALAVQPPITPLVYHKIRVYDDHYINPFVQYLFNEQKLKVKWKGKWYDFIIKNCDESSDSRLVTYTCEDQFISELSRQGFNLIYDIEKQNNIDTAPNLVESVLKGTDWSYDADNSDIIREYVEEAVYAGSTTGGAGVTAILENGEEVRTVLSGYGTLLLFYSQVNQLLVQDYEDGARVDLGWFEFYYVDNEPIVEKDGMLITNGSPCYIDNISATYSASGNYWRFHNRNTGPSVPFFTLAKDEMVSTQYRARRIVRHVKSRHDPLTNRVCQIWKYNNSDDEIYRYTNTEVLDCTAVNNLIVNPEQFTTSMSWYIYTNGEEAPKQPSIDCDTAQVDYRLRTWFKNDARASGLKLAEEQQYLLNKALQGSATYFSNGLVKDTSYIVSYDLLLTPEEVVDLSSGLFTPHIYAYKDIDTIVLAKNANDEDLDFLKIVKPFDPKVKKAFEWDVNEQNYFAIYTFKFEVSVTKPISRKKLYDGFVENGEWYKYGFFFSQDGQAIERRLCAARFYPKVELQKGEEKVIITPDNFKDFDAEPLVYIQYNYYNRSKATRDKVTDTTNLEYLYQNKEDLVDPNLQPIPIEDYARQATINIKQSNRFNILQTIAEQFQCWVQFVIDHYEDGTIKSKQIRIKKGDTLLGANLGYGFIYGVDLKAIKRNIKSNALSTKTIVLQNSNEFGTYGFCAIGRARDNPSGADYILNFDYYVSKGLIDRNQLTIDMYGPTGLYTVLSRNYKPLDEKLALEQSYTTEKEKFLALYNGADEGRTSAAKQIEDSKQYIRSLVRDTQIDEENFDIAVVNYIESQKVIGGVSTIQSEYYKYKNAQSAQAKFEAQYKAYGAQLGENGIEGKLQQLGVEIATHREAIFNAEKRFYELYSRFIQEGTWNDEKYYDDNLYYLDALQVAYTSARPEVSYTIDVLRVGALEEFKGKDFDVGDVTFIEDTEYFGYDLVYGVKTPHKEPVYIYEITYYFEEPEKDVVKVQNYKTQFEDLFQRITAETQSLQFAQGSYARAANLLSSSGALNTQKVQEAIQANQKISGNMNNILQDGTGYTVIDKDNPNIMTKLTSRGLSSSVDGGVTWSKVVDSGEMAVSALQTGVLDANKNPIMVSYDGNRLGFGEVDLSGVLQSDRPKGAIYGLYGAPYLEFYYNAADRSGPNDLALWRVRIDVDEGITFAYFSNGSWVTAGQIPVQ